MFKKITLLTLCALGLAEAQQNPSNQIISAILRQRMVALQNLAAPAAQDSVAPTVALAVTGWAGDVAASCLDLAKNIEGYDKFIMENRLELVEYGKNYTQLLHGMSKIVYDMNMLVQDMINMAKGVSSKAKDGVEYLGYMAAVPIVDGQPVSADAQMLFDMAAANLPALIKLIAGFQDKFNARLTQIIAEYKVLSAGFTLAVKSTEAGLDAEVTALEAAVEKLRARKHALMDAKGADCGATLFSSRTACAKIDKELVPIKKALAVAKAKQERFSTAVEGLARTKAADFAEEITSLQEKIAPVGAFLKKTGGDVKLPAASNANIQALTGVFAAAKKSADELAESLKKTESELERIQGKLNRARANDAAPAKLIVGEIEAEPEYIPKPKEPEAEETEKKPSGEKNPFAEPKKPEEEPRANTRWGFNTMYII